MCSNFSRKEDIIFILSDKKFPPLPQKTQFLIFKSSHHKNIWENNPKQKLPISVHIARGNLDTHFQNTSP